MALHYLVKLLEILVLFNPKQDKPNNPLIRKGTVDSLKDAGVFQALQENYPSVLVCCHALCIWMVHSRLIWLAVPTLRWDSSTGTP